MLRATVYTARSMESTTAVAGMSTTCREQVGMMKMSSRHFPHLSALLGQL
jgi:hypothetical protein